MLPDPVTASPTVTLPAPVVVKLWTPMLSVLLPLRVSVLPTVAPRVASPARVICPDKVLSPPRLWMTPAPPAPAPAMSMGELNVKPPDRARLAPLLIVRVLVGLREAAAARFNVPPK